MQNDERFPSYTILSIEELNDLLKKCSMTGKILVDKFGFNRKEIINFEKTIGKLMHVENILMLHMVKYIIPKLVLI